MIAKDFIGFDRDPAVSQKSPFKTLYIGWLTVHHDLSSISEMITEMIYAKA